MQCFIVFILYLVAYFHTDNFVFAEFYNKGLYM